MCKNISNIKAGKSEGTLDLTSKQQNFIFGLGPTEKPLKSESQTAGIRRHTLYGQFSMDLSKATVANAEEVNHEYLGNVGNWEISNAQLVGGVTNDHDWSGPVHAVLMGGTFVALFPIGVVFLRVLENVKWHAWMQGVGVVFIIIGVGVGVYLGKEYNHVSQYFAWTTFH